jgi:hypothetical protein
MRPRIAPCLILLALVAGCTGSGAISSGSADPKGCEGLSADYASALMKATECAVGGANQCTESVIGSFTCRCPVFAEGDTSELTMIAGRFDAMGCVGGCTGSCAMPQSATCQSDTTSSTGGRCVSMR